MTSAASRPSTAATKAALTRPRLRSGPRYHIGNGALSIRWVSASSAPSVCCRRRISFARSASASLMSNSQTSTEPGLAGGGASAARSSTTLLPTGQAQLAAERRAAQPDVVKRSIKGGEILAIEAAFVAGQFVQAVAESTASPVRAPAWRRPRSCRRHGPAAPAPARHRAAIAWSAPRRAPTCARRRRRAARIASAAANATHRAAMTMIAAAAFAPTITLPAPEHHRTRHRRRVPAKKKGGTPLVPRPSSCICRILEFGLGADEQAAAVIVVVAAQQRHLGEGAIGVPTVETSGGFLSNMFDTPNRKVKPFAASISADRL